MMMLAPRHFTELLASSPVYTRAPYLTLEAFRGLRAVMDHSCILL